MREKIAAIQHAIWAHWMEYLFLVSETNTDGTVTIPAPAVAGWKRLIETPYEELSELQQRSDLEQADKVIAILPPFWGIDGQPRQYQEYQAYKDER